MGNCESTCIARVMDASSGNGKNSKGHTRGGRGGIRHRRIKSEHKHQGPIYWKYHENTSALEYYEPIRSIGEGSIGSIHLVRRRPKKIHVPYQECLEIIIDSTDHVDSSSASSSDDGIEAEEKTDQNHTQEQLFVLKSILKDHLQDDECLNEMRSEIHNMKYLDHPHIGKVYEAFEKKRMVWMVMENLSGGDLRSRMPYTEAEAADIIRDVLSAVVYLHKRGVVHRDLKLEK